MYDKDEVISRLEKLRDLIKKGEVPYKGRFDKTHTLAQIDAIEEIRTSEDVMASPRTSVKTAGRIRAIRNHGNIIFCDIQDVSGEIQIALKKDVLTSFSDLKQFLDPGDFIGVSGEPFITKTNAKAVLACDAVLLSKALRPLPSETIEDTEIRYRKRYLDFIVNETSRKRIQVRSLFVQALREWLLEKDFLEVDTRMLQTYSGGALAEPFTTHHRYLNIDMALRISNELDLKMAVAGGFERVFEFATDLRNEGIDASHLQEFQMLEWYCAYENYETNLEWSKEMLRYALKKALGTTQCDIVTSAGLHSTIDFSQTIPIRTYEEVLAEKGVDVWASKKDLETMAIQIGVERDIVETKDRGGILDEVFKKKVRPHIKDPLFIKDYPADLFPLARRKDDNPNIAESFQLIVAGWEIIKAYSELIHPKQQRDAFLEQEQSRKGGDKEAMHYNREFLTAMEHGMPPITGFGMGIERIVTLITGASNLKESVLFPLLAPDNTPNDDLPYDTILD